MASNNNALATSKSDGPARSTMASPSSDTEVLFKQSGQQLGLSTSTGDLHINYAIGSGYASDGETITKKKKTLPGLVGSRPFTAIESAVTLCKSMAMTDIAGAEAEATTGGKNRFTDIPTYVGAYTASASTLSLDRANSAESVSVQFVENQ